MTLPTTPSQTVGPYLHIGLPWADGPFAVAPDHADAITIAGRVLDASGDPVPDALVEIWHADPAGTFAHADRHPDGRDDDRQPYLGFRGFARCDTRDGGRFSFVTLKPGRVAAPQGGLQAPHIAVSVFARGLLHRLVTRWYFADEPEANAADPVLGRVDADRRATLLLVPDDAGYRLDVHLQGPDETVFFDL